MDERTVTGWSMTITGEQWATLRDHLFPGDQDEHGAVLRCGTAVTSRGTRLLVREVIPALDGIDYVPGDRGYRKLTADFVAGNALACADDQSVYIAVHCHGGTDTVRFSSTDLDSHERGYPALLQLTRAPAVGALVFASAAVAGDLWLADGTRTALDHLTITGPTRRVLTAAPERVDKADPAFDRQVRIFGDQGQAILAELKIGIVGAGGAGSQINQILARLGVGQIVLIDDDRVETSNLPRLVGATRFDAHTWMTDTSRPAWIRRLGARAAATKVDVARRVARTASRSTNVEAVVGSVADPEVARHLIDCDHIFLAADSATARLVVNALGHQYLIPVTQVGAKVTADQITGRVLQIFSVGRLNGPGSGCLKCAGLISPNRLRDEATDPDQLKRQSYVDEPGVSAPSVITLNSVATSHAVNDWLMRTIGLSTNTDTTFWVSVNALTGSMDRDFPRRDKDCGHCGPARLGSGDAIRLPTRLR
jgi:molybdopterin/thiamine biosynthesis adenylyltransferase